MTNHIDTQLIHAGEPQPRTEAAIPIHHSSVWATAGGGSYHDIPYPRLSNLPNHTVLAKKLAAVEGGDDAVVTASGMAAITTALLAVLGKGGHLLAQDCLYGGTQSFVAADLAAFGMSAGVLDAAHQDAWDKARRAETRAVYVEAITNPLIRVIDHRAVVAFAKRHGLVSIIDNTFATPVNFKPLALGYDLVVHSATKYLNGHSDLVAGAVIGRRDLIERVRRLLNHLGGCLEPHACYMLYRGMRTLALRVRQQNANALAVARFLAARDEVERVNYPGLPTHPDHGIAAALFSGFGGMLSFELAGADAEVERFLAAVRLPIVGPSLGGVETLLTRPARTSHLGLSAAERARIGIRDSLIRMSVGIEASEDLIADLAQAFNALRAPAASARR